jgi:hypothetical protein
MEGNASVSECGMLFRGLTADSKACSAIDGSGDGLGRGKVSLGAMNSACRNNACSASRARPVRAPGSSAGVGPSGIAAAELFAAKSSRARTSFVEAEPVGASGPSTLVEPGAAAEAFCAKPREESIRERS